MLTSASGNRSRRETDQYCPSLRVRGGSKHHAKKRSAFAGPGADSRKGSYRRRSTIKTTKIDNVQRRTVHLPVTSLTRQAPPSAAQQSPSIGPPFSPRIGGRSGPLVRGFNKHLIRGPLRLPLPTDCHRSAMALRPCRVPPMPPPFRVAGGTRGGIPARP